MQIIIYYILFILLSIYILTINNVIVTFVLCLLFYTSVFAYSIKKYSFYFAITRVLILSLPFSFINIFGGDYGELPISWFNIIVVIVLFLNAIYFLFKGYILKTPLSLISIIMILITSIVFISSEDYIESFNDLVNNSVPFILALFGFYIKENITKKQTNVLEKDYVFTTIIAGIGVFIQFILKKTVGIEIGTYQFLGGYREAYGYLFSDYSFYRCISFQAHLYCIYLVKITYITSY
ncbi:hypothetical protein [Lentibacillus cibarius]|uniref:O-antigen ligase family protein n=1 Tax=Lentibacillus cibarius TaxID=2583219 RepID=A0A5S3R7J7_9BACI|nr:hypothetical protein [Lentibacillus cibarius]TMN21933.1 hypothetical protein FFL34_07235 [Lentibacillus cibarius]